ncbi:MAG: glycosyltransferase [Candidatus Thorarchaeota archaeon]|nr:MAG: glycosyltransferase [Candidatus Thorarchaeota archaeon]
MKVVLYGGFIDHQIQLANALCENHDLLLILCVRSVPKELLSMIDKRVRYQVVGRGQSSYHPMNIVHLIDILKHIRKFKPDLVHLEMGGAWVDMIFFQFLRPYPIVTTFHDVVLHRGEYSEWTERIRTYIRKRSDKIIVHGRRLRETAIDSLGLDPNTVHVVPLGAPELPAFKMHEKPELREVQNQILFFGRIREYKGLGCLIKAEPRITQEIPGAKIVIAGAGREMARYQPRIRERPHSFDVRNRQISYAEGAELFQKCSIVVLPYTEASQSGVVPVAYGFKKPVVVTRVGSIPEIVDDEITGLIIPPNDPGALAEAIIRLLKDERLRHEMGENGFRRLSEPLSWKRIAEETIKVYNEAME